MKTKKFLVIYHEWFMDTGYFSHKVLEVDSKERANEIAGSEAHKRNKTFNQCDYHLVELTNGEEPLKVLTKPGRKLSLFERITGLTNE